VSSHEERLNLSLATAIRAQHGNLDQLKSNFSAAALGFAGSGWIWFVSDKFGHTAIVPTFGAGTLLIRSRIHMGATAGKGVEDATLG
jgi:superoxide dismutase, Fe-Mn family